MDTENEIVGTLAARWWTLLARGLAAIGFGIVAFAMPVPSLLGLVFVWGAYALTDGAFELVLAVHRGRRGLRWGWYFFEGLVSLGAGILAFAWPGITAMALTTLIGAWALLTGVAEIVAAIELRKVVSAKWLLALCGVASIAFGFLVFARPLLGALTMVGILGAYAVAFGAMLVALAFQVRHWGRGRKPATHVHAPRFA